MPRTAPNPEHMAAIGRVGARTKQVQAVERRIRELVDASPPLSDDQRSRLALLLRKSA